MSLRKTAFLALATAVAVVAPLGRATAQEVAGSQDYSLSPGLSARADWERRVVRRSAPSTHTAPAARRGAWAPTRGVAMQTGQPAQPQVQRTEPIVKSAPQPPAAAPQPVMTADGDIQFQQAPGEVIGAEGPMYPGDDCRECGPDGADLWCGCGEDGTICPIAGPGLFRNFSFRAGMHGFKGPVDGGLNGNFGVHEGFMVAGPLGNLFAEGVRDIGWQVGLNAFQSNFKGDQVLGALRTADRNQIFVTAGLFRRAQCVGTQWGLAFDFLHDSYWDTADLRQIRGEFGYVGPAGNEIGFRGVFGVADNDMLNDDLDIMHQYTVYLRRQFDEGGEGQVWVGATDQGDGIFGGSISVPVSGSVAIEHIAQYMLAQEGPETGGQARESWSISLNLVWYPGRAARCVYHDPYRPLFGVADNAAFLINRLPALQNGGGDLDDDGDDAEALEGVPVQ